MTFMVNVDLETQNMSGGDPDCRSGGHRGLGWHDDLTVHLLGCSYRRGRGAHRERRYWDDNDEQGYSIDEVTDLINEIRGVEPDAYARRCRVCGVPANPPYWD